ncbi:MAG: hypothetical protein JO132_11300 [Streptosporangiaceae bacterium]|nr:hypothetical protein [Streptosporangiaceae bacterium]
MSGTTAGTWAIMGVAMVSLAALLILVCWYAPTHPAHKNHRSEELRGLVVGGQHVGGGRSVAPTRDAPVPEGDMAPVAGAPDVENPGTEQPRSSGQGRRASGSPMDL